MLSHQLVIWKVFNITLTWYSDWRYPVTYQLGCNCEEQHKDETKNKCSKIHGPKIIKHDREIRIIRWDRTHDIIISSLIGWTIDFWLNVKLYEKEKHANLLKEAVGSEGKISLHYQSLKPWFWEIKLLETFVP